MHQPMEQPSWMFSNASITHLNNITWLTLTIIEHVSRQASQHSRLTIAHDHTSEPDLSATYSSKCTTHHVVVCFVLSFSPSSLSSSLPCPSPSPVVVFVFACPPSSFPCRSRLRLAAPCRPSLPLLSLAQVSRWQRTCCGASPKLKAGRRIRFRLPSQLSSNCKQYRCSWQIRSRPKKLSSSSEATALARRVK